MTAPLSLVEALAGSAEDRYHRQKLIAWWDQERVARARVLVVGAGALGGEVLKLLALTGVGNTVVVDTDVVERSNLSRGVLLRDGDEGRSKAEVSAARMRELNPDVRVAAVRGDVNHDVGLGVFLWADVVICGLDNRLARVFVNAACARTGRVWVDGAIEGFCGVVRVFDPARSACYECTMNEVDRRILAERRSCAMLARRAAEAGHVPTTATTASLVAALQVQEAIKLLHGQPTLMGEGLHVDGQWGEFSRVRYPRRPDCPGHSTPCAFVPLGLPSTGTTLGDLLGRAERAFGEGASLDLGRDVVTSLECPRCGGVERRGASLGALGERDAACPSCGAHRIVEFAGSVTRDGSVDLSRTPAEAGLPAFDAITARRGLGAREAWVLDGDAEAVLGPVAPGFDPARIGFGVGPGGGPRVAQ